MDKKALRKELELTLVKTIEEVLNKRNSVVAKKIKKATYGSAKAIAKKFYKAIKAIKEKKTIPTKKIIKKPVKAAITKVKAKIKK